MKKLLAFLLVAVMMFSLAACGENTDKPSGGTDKPGTSQADNKGEKKEISFKEATADNWNTVIKDNVGMQFELPDGWQVKSVSTTKKSIQMTFMTDYEQTQSDALCKEFSKTVFEQTQAVATGDVYDFNDIDKESIGVSYIEDKMFFDLEAPFHDDVIVVMCSYSVPKEYKMTIMIK